jgi:hypothetical protein
MKNKSYIDFPVSYGGYFFINPFSFFFYCLFQHPSGILTDDGLKLLFKWFYSRWYLFPDHRRVAFSGFRVFGFTSIDTIWLCQTEEQAQEWEDELIGNILKELDLK